MAAGRFRVELTQGAEDDLEAIFDYVVETSSSANAEGLLDSLLEAVDTLEQFPMRGSIPRELDSLGVREFRQLIVLPYRLIYRIDGNVVFIMVIADGRRDMQALLARRVLKG